MVEIEFAEFIHTYRILWLRYVDGVNLGEHCMKSLLGHNDKRVKFWAKTLPSLILEEAPFYYLCGVEAGWDWNKNLHLAFVHSEGHTVEVDDDKVHIRIKNARRLPITDTYINHRLPCANKPSYHTCRNWQFANMLVHLYPNIRQRPIKRPTQTSIDFET